MCLEKSGEVVCQMVPRVNETAEGVIRTEFSVDCYNISVVDWEEDGSIGSLGIPVNVTYENSDGCTSGTGIHIPYFKAYLCLVHTQAHFDLRTCMQNMIKDVLNQYMLH